MTYDAHANFAASLVATAPSPATSGTSLHVTTGDGSKFPSVPFNAVLYPANSLPTASNAEIVRVTAISTDTFTITRAQEGTSAKSVTTQYAIEAAITAKTLTDVENNVSILRSYQARATANKSSFTTLSDITGPNVSVVVTGSNATVKVWATFDFSCGSPATFTGHLNWNGSDQTPQAIFICPTATGRATVAQFWEITGVTAGTYTAKLQASCTVSASTNTVEQTHTGISVLVIDS